MYFFVSFAKVHEVEKVSLINSIFLGFSPQKLMKFRFFSFQGGSSAPRNAYPGAAPPHIKGTPRPSGQAMTSPAGAISSAPYRGGAGWTQGYAPAQQTYRYSAPIAAQPAYAYTQHTTTTVSSQDISTKINQVSSNFLKCHPDPESH